MASDPPRSRVCFHSQVDPARIPDYRERHAAVWPDMLAALRDSGWHNYSLFLRDDGLLIGYVETDSLDAARAAMATHEVNARWQAEMSELFDDESGGAPDAGFQVLEEIFNLDDQLARASATAPDTNTASHDTNTAPPAPASATERL